jgi:hypothetical protein
MEEFCGLLAVVVVLAITVIVLATSWRLASLLGSYSEEAAPGLGSGPRVYEPPRGWASGDGGAP